jgi:flagellar hook protein FlgE
MLRSMFSAVSGLRSHQTMMDVVGNNIANVNTAGYKSSAIIFEDLLSQVLRGAGSPQNGNGGTNPAQVGLGVRVAGIATSFTQGTSQLTGRSTDLAIQGDGFFMVKNAGQTLYTRAGNFSFDADGTMVNPNGAVAQGWIADSSGNVDTNSSPTGLKLPIGQILPPRRTQNVTVGGNIPADAAVGSAIVNSISVFDRQGTEVPLQLTWTKTATDTWSVAASTPAGAAGTTTVTFDPTTGVPTPSTLAVTPAGSFGGGITVDLADRSTPLREFAGMSTIAAVHQDGYTTGSLQSFAISQEGLIAGVFSNGLTQAVGQVALAAFTNPAGLEKAGDTMFRTSVNSGVPQVGTAGGGGRGILSGGTLEMSNVDLGQEFTNLIVAERGFQANSRVISASDELLQDLVNLKR